MWPPAALLAPRSGGFSQITADTISYFDMYGPILIGALLGVFMFAAVISYIYFYLHPNDPRRTRLLWAQTLTAGHSGCARGLKLFVLHPGDKEYFLELYRRREVFVERLLACLTCNVAQAFMVVRLVRFAHGMRAVNAPAPRPAAAHRGRPARARALAARVRAAGRAAKSLAVRCLCSRWFFHALVVVLGLQWLFCLASGLALSIYIGTLHTWHELGWTNGRAVGMYSLLVNLQGISFMTLDAMITVFSLWFFGRAKTGFGASDKVLNSMLFITLRTGALATAAQIAQLMTFHLTTTTWCESTPLFIAQMFSVSVLAVLLEPRAAHAEYYKRQLAWAADSGGDAGGSSGGVGGHCPACAQPLSSAAPSARTTGLGLGLGIGLGMGEAAPAVARARGKAAEHDGERGTDARRASESSGGGLLSFAAALSSVPDRAGGARWTPALGQRESTGALLALPVALDRPTYTPSLEPLPAPAARARSPSLAPPIPLAHSALPAMPALPAPRPASPGGSACCPAPACTGHTHECSGYTPPHEHVACLATAGVDLADPADARSREERLAERGLARADSMPLTAATVEIPLDAEDGADAVSITEVLRSNLFW